MIERIKFSVLPFLFLGVFLVLAGSLVVSHNTALALICSMDDVCVGGDGGGGGGGGGTQNPASCSDGATNCGHTAPYLINVGCTTPNACSPQGDSCTDYAYFPSGNFTSSNYTGRVFAGSGVGTAYPPDDDSYTKLFNGSSMVWSYDWAFCTCGPGSESGSNCGSENRSKPPVTQNIANISEGAKLTVAAVNKCKGNGCGVWGAGSASAASTATYCFTNAMNATPPKAGSYVPSGRGTCQYVPPAACTIDVNFSPKVIEYNGNTTASWSSTNATNLQYMCGSFVWSSLDTPSGSAPFTGQTSSLTCNVRADNIVSGGPSCTDSDSFTVCSDTKHVSGGSCVNNSCSSANPPSGGTSCNNNSPAENNQAWSEVATCGSTACTYYRAGAGDVSCTASHTFTPANIGASESSSEWYNFTNWDTSKFNYTWRCVNDTVTKSGNLSQNDLTQTKTVDGTTFIVGKTTTCIVTATPKSGVSGTGCSASASLTIGAPALSCSPASQSVLASPGAESHMANFTAAGGLGTLRWSTSGSPYGSPMAGTGNTFSTSYSSCGGKTITVADDSGQTASCDLNVTGCDGGGSCNNNGIQDNGETGVDCGGGNCPACGGTCPSGTYNPHYTCSASKTCQRVDNCGTNSGGCNYTNEQMSCGIPPPQIGDIWVNSSPNSSWVITGRANISGSGDSAEYRGKPTGSYTLTAEEGFVVNGGSRSATLVLARGKTIVFNITGTPLPLSCSSDKSSARTGEEINYAASGGTGNFSWSGGGTPPSGGNLSSFATSFATAGNYLVRVTRGADTADCPSVVISEPPTVSVTLTANPVSGMINLLSRITAVVGGTATGPISYEFWKNCQGISCGTPDATIGSDANSEYTEFTYTAANTYHPKVTIVREGLTDSANATVTATPKKYACVSGSCSISNDPNAFTTMASCADACVHSECTALNACTSTKADPATGVGGPNRCSSDSDCPAPKKYGCASGFCREVSSGGSSDPTCGGSCAVPPPQKYSCKSGSCQPDATGQYTDSTCGGVCTPTYYSCSSGTCSADSTGQFTSVDCNNMCVVPIHSECNGPACINVSGAGENKCDADNGPQGCGGITESHLGCVNSACVVLGGPGENSCNSVGQYCGGSGKCSLKVAPPLISGGQSTKLTWTCSGTPTCKLTRKYKNSSTVITLQDPAGTPEGSYSEKPASSATYTLDCEGSISDATADVKVSTLIECAPTDPTCKP